MAGISPRRGALIEGINVTPLVDITLVLLIIFIVTARLVVMPAVPLDLPTASQSEEVPSVLSIALPSQGAMQVDGAVVDEAALIARIRAARGRDPELRAVIQADRAVPHGRVLSVLDILKAEGLVRVAFGAARSDGSGGPPVSGAHANTD
jgi:biopolymer transport protein TolR